jgi:hypothetical protein
MSGSGGIGMGYDGGGYDGGGVGGYSGSGLRGGLNRPIVMGKLVTSYYCYYC